MRTLQVTASHTPGVALLGADVGRLPLQPRSCAGAISFYSIHHLPRRALPAALAELRRILVDGGVLLIATHVGEGEIYSETDWMGHAIAPIGGTLYTTDELLGQLTSASFVVESIGERDPLPDERRGPRTYILARRALASTSERSTLL